MDEKVKLVLLSTRKMALTCIFSFHLPIEFKVSKCSSWEFDILGFSHFKWFAQQGLTKK